MRRKKTKEKERHGIWDMGISLVLHMQLPTDEWGLEGINCLASERVSFQPVFVDLEARGGGWIKWLATN